MIDVGAVHDDAMAAADAGDLARRRGDHLAARQHFARAMELERLAADAESTQPSRSILYRSAAWLALEAEDVAEAERLAACGLAGFDVPERVKAELRAVSEDARLRLTRPLPPPTAVSSVTLHMEGPEVGYGTAAVKDIEPRREAVVSLLTRTAERRASTPFRRRGTASAAVVTQLEPRVRFAPGSVVIQIELGGGQPELWDANAAIIEDVRACILAQLEGRDADLRASIPDDTYRENFSLLVGRLAPDGQRVTSVDVLLATGRGPLPTVRLRESVRTASRGPAMASGGATETLVGELRGADETKLRSTITLMLSGPSQATRSIDVGDAAMEDIVRPLYGRQVQVTVTRKGKRWELVGVPELVDG